MASDLKLGGCGGKGHTLDNWTGKLCKEHADAKPWCVFSLDRGYVWGPGHPQAGKVAFPPTSPRSGNEPSDPTR